MSSIAYSRGRSVHDDRPAQRTARDFADFVAQLDADRAPDKRTAPYVCGPLNGDGRRCAEGALPRRWLALDLDGIAPDVLGDVLMWFARFSGTAWPTHSSTPERPRYRVILELDRDATRSECMQLGEVLRADLRREFGDAVKADPCTERGEQPVFCPPQGPVLSRFEGEPLDADNTLRRAARKPEREPPQAEQHGSDDMLERLRRGEALHETMARFTAQLAAAGVKRDTLEAAALGVLELARPARGGRVDEFVRGELQRLVDGALRKYAPRGAYVGEGGASVEWALPEPIGDDEMTRARLTPRCIVENYLFADVATLIAPGSTGKTTATLYEAVCIVLGMPLWGLPVVTPGPVLIVTAEDRREYLVARLREICAAMRLSDVAVRRVREAVRIADHTTSIRKLTAIVGDVVVAAGFAEQVVDAARDLAPVLVQFDPLVSFGVGESRTNDAEQALIEAGRVITGGLDCCTRFVHHTGKAPALDRRTDQYTGRGGSALADGSRMVIVMQALDEAELLKATDERLGEGESAFALHRPKLTYAPPQRAPLYVKRKGFAFELLRAKSAQSPDERARTLGEQLARFIASELQAGRRHTRNSLREMRPESMSRGDVMQALAWLDASGRLVERELLDATGKRPATGARTYLEALQVGGPMAGRGAE